MRANSDRFGRSIGCRRSHILQVRKENASGDTGNFRTDTAEIFCFSSRFDAISDAAAFSADFTDSSHGKF